MTPCPAARHGEDAAKQRGHAIVGTASKTIPYLERLIKGKG